MPMSTLMQRSAEDHAVIDPAGQTESLESAKQSRAFLWMFVVLVAAYCAWVFSLPLFPTQDDPMHLYYTRIVQELLAHSPRFDAAYFIRIPPPPYVVHYALLLLFTSFLNPVTAEKCMVCVILVSTAFGFRFLGKAVGRHGELMALWILPLLLSWPLFMGFHNYCLALSFSLWACGLWVRASGTNDTRLWSAFLLVVVICLFTHPIPLLFVLGLTGLDLTVRILQKRFFAGVSWTSVLLQLKWDIGCSLLAGLTLFYLSLFVNNTGSTQQLTAPLSKLALLSGFARLQWMCFGTGGLFTKLYRCGLYVALLLGVVLAIRNKAVTHLRSSSAAKPLLIAAVFLVIALPLLPANINGSEHFSDRLPIFAWICALAAGSAAGSLSPGIRRTIAISGCVFSVLTLIFADRLIRPVAKDIAQIETIPIRPHNAGLLFDGPVWVQNEHLTFDPYLRWVGARYFRRSDAVLVNGPWLSPPFPLPIQRRRSALTSRFSSLELLDPPTLHRHLMNSAADREAVLSSVDVLVFVGKPQRHGLAPDPLLALDTARGWSCTSFDWYFVCETSRRAKGALAAAHR